MLSLRVNTEARAVHIFQRESSLQVEEDRSLKKAKTVRAFHRAPLRAPTYRSSCSMVYHNISLEKGSMAFRFASLPYPWMKKET